MDGIDSVDDVLVPLAAGGVAGLGLAVAIVQPRTTVVPWSDETAVAVAIPTGIVVAVLTRLTARTAFPGRLRATLGSTTAHKWEYALAYRAALTRQFGVDASIIVGNDSWEHTEPGRACSLFGCITGDFLVDARYEQMVAAVGRAVYMPFPSSTFRPSIALGGGPTRVRTERFKSTMTERTGALADLMVSVERGWLTADIGVRVGTTDAESTAEASVYVRLGYALGAHL